MSQIRRILHPSDFSRASSPAFALAVDMAKTHGAELLVIHVLAPLAHSSRRLRSPESLSGPRGPDPRRRREAAGCPGRAGAESRREGLEPPAGRPPGRSHRRGGQVVAGQPHRTRHPRPHRAGQVLLGSVAARMVAIAPCPVLTVRGSSGRGARPPLRGPAPDGLLWPIRGEGTPCGGRADGEATTSRTGAACPCPGACRGWHRAGRPGAPRSVLRGRPERGPPGRPRRATPPAVERPAPAPRPTTRARVRLRRPRRHRGHLEGPVSPDEPHLRGAPARAVLRRGRSACGFAQAAVGPFYCPADRKLYLDTSFFRDLHDRFGAPGDFAQAYVIAHEVGHHVQTLLGISDEVMSMRRAGEPRRGQRPPGADGAAGRLLRRCLGAERPGERKILEEGDIEEGLNAAAAIGDDRLQRQSQGTSSPESFTHGSSAQRVRWFKRGPEHRRPAAV